jgi:hypothetical protein
VAEDDNHYSHRRGNLKSYIQFNSSASKLTSRQAGVPKLDSSLSTAILYPVSSSDCVPL